MFERSRSNVSWIILFTWRRGVQYLHFLLLGHSKWNGTFSSESRQSKVWGQLKILQFRKPTESYINLEFQAKFSLYCFFWPLYEVALGQSFVMFQSDKFRLHSEMHSTPDRERLSKFESTSWSTRCKWERGNRWKLGLFQRRRRGVVFWWC